MKKQTSANGLYTANTDERNGLSSEQQSRIKERVANGAKHYTIEDLHDTIRRGARACKLAQRIAPWVSEKVELTGNLLRDYWNGIYRELPWTTIAALGFAIAYLLNPFDLIPDFIPGLGLLDDERRLPWSSRPSPTTCRPTQSGSRTMRNCRQPATSPPNANLPPAGRSSHPPGDRGTPPNHLSYSTKE